MWPVCSHLHRSHLEGGCLLVFEHSTNAWLNLLQVIPAVEFTCVFFLFYAYLIHLTTFNDRVLEWTPHRRHCWMLISHFQVKIDLYTTRLPFLHQHILALKSDSMQNLTSKMSFFVWGNKMKSHKTDRNGCSDLGLLICWHVHWS